MLSDPERTSIDEELAGLPDRRSACVHALEVVQRRKGWVDDEALDDVARYLEMPLAELEGVATFFNLVFRRPVGRHVVFACSSVTCWMLGYDRLVDAFRERLGVEPGGTTADDRFTLLPIRCLGACDHAPAVMVGEDLYEDVSPDRLDAILERYG